MDGVLKKLRTSLRMKQSGIAKEIGISRGLWSVHESKDVPGGDHDVPPHIARALIKLARAKGLPLTYEHLYEGAQLPEMVLVPAAVLKRRGRMPKAPPPPEPPKRPRRVVVA